MSERGAEMNETGWQVDGSYVPCPECKWEPEPDCGPGRAVHFPGTTHHGDCPTVRLMSRDDERALHKKLDEMDRVRRRGAAEARNYVIY